MGGFGYGFGGGLLQGLSRNIAQNRADSRTSALLQGDIMGMQGELPPEMQSQVTPQAPQSGLAGILSTLGIGGRQGPSIEQLIMQRAQMARQVAMYKQKLTTYQAIIKDNPDLSPADQGKILDQEQNPLLKAMLGGMFQKANRIKAAQQKFFGTLQGTPQEAEGGAIPPEGLPNIPASPNAIAAAGAQAFPEHATQFGVEAMKLQNQPPHFFPPSPGIPGFAVNPRPPYGATPIPGTERPATSPKENAQRFADLEVGIQAEINRGGNKAQVEARLIPPDIQAMGIRTLEDVRKARVLHPETQAALGAQRLAEGFMAGRMGLEQAKRTTLPVDPKTISNYVTLAGQTPQGDPNFTGIEDITPQNLRKSGYRYLPEDRLKAFNASSIGLTQIQRIEQMGTKLFQGIGEGENVLNALKLRGKAVLGDADVRGFEAIINETLPTNAIASGLTPGRVGEQIIENIERPIMPNMSDTIGSFKKKLAIIKQRLQNNRKITFGLGIPAGTAEEEAVGSTTTPTTQKWQRNPQTGQLERVQ